MLGYECLKADKKLDELRADLSIQPDLVLRPLPIDHCPFSPTIISNATLNPFRNATMLVFAVQLPDCQLVSALVRQDKIVAVCSVQNKDPADCRIQNDF